MGSKPRKGKEAAPPPAAEEEDGEGGGEEGGGMGPIDVDDWTGADNIRQKYNDDMTRKRMESKKPGAKAGIVLGMHGQGSAKTGFAQLCAFWQSEEVWCMDVEGLCALMPRMFCACLLGLRNRRLR